MAFQYMVQGQGPQIDVSLFGNAAVQGAQVAQMSPSPIAAAAKGITEGIKTASDLNLNDAKIAESNAKVTETEAQAKMLQTQQEVLAFKQKEVQDDKDFVDNVITPVINDPSQYNNIASDPRWASFAARNPNEAAVLAEQQQRYTLMSPEDQYVIRQRGLYDSKLAALQAKNAPKIAELKGMSDNLNNNSIVQMAIQNPKLGVAAGNSSDFSEQVAKNTTFTTAYPNGADGKPDKTQAPQEKIYVKKWFGDGGYVDITPSDASGAIDPNVQKELAQSKKDISNFNILASQYGTSQETGSQIAIHSATNDELLKNYLSKQHAYLETQTEEGRQAIINKMKAGINKVAAAKGLPTGFSDDVKAPVDKPVKDELLSAVLTPSEFNGVSKVLAEADDSHDLTKTLAQPVGQQYLSDAYKIKTPDVVSKATKDLAGIEKELASSRVDGSIPYVNNQPAGGMMVGTLAAYQAADDWNRIVKDSPKGKTYYSDPAQLANFNNKRIAQGLAPVNTPLDFYGAENATKLGIRATDTLNNIIIDHNRTFSTADNQLALANKYNSDTWDADASNAIIPQGGVTAPAKRELTLIAKTKQPSKGILSDIINAIPGAAAPQQFGMPEATQEPTTPSTSAPTKSNFSIGDTVSAISNYLSFIPGVVTDKPASYSSATGNVQIASPNTYNPVSTSIPTPSIVGASSVKKGIPAVFDAPSKLDSQLQTVTPKRQQYLSNLATKFLSRVNPYMDTFVSASKEQGIPLSYALATAARESAGRIGAVSSKKASGLMQLTPDAIADVRSHQPDLVQNWDRLSPEDNIRVGIAYLRILADRTGGNLTDTSASYNAGMGKIKHITGINGRIPTETSQYVPEVKTLMSILSDVG